MFDIVTGVRQGCIISPFLFLLVIDFIMKKTTSDDRHGIKWGTGILNDLDFADDITMLSNTHMGLQIMTNKLHENGERSRVPH
jgi:hypothetical protein